jgi:ribosomal protein S18 acetylase RimI-like enzyme
MTTTPVISLRPATAADRDFLRDLYAGTRAGELALVPWDSAAKRTFVEHQFHAQDVHYRRYYAEATFAVVEVAGERAGRLYVDRGEDDIRVMDITLLPAFRGLGVGTQLLRTLIDEAQASGRTASIQVAHANPARALYARLGFETDEAGSVQLLMTWRDAARAAVMEA